MSLSSLQFAFLNTTTIENLNRKVKVWQLAIHIPDATTPPGTALPGSQPLPAFGTITYPLPQPMGTRRDLDTRGSSSDEEKATPLVQRRKFAILTTRPGENPWDLGWAKNFQSVMGRTPFDWFVPLRRSPCANHDSLESRFAVGSVVDRLRREAGLLPPLPEQGSRKTEERSASRWRRLDGNGSSRDHSSSHEKRQS